MNEPLRSHKLKAWHLDRRAIVYVRQSTPQQVADHQESTARQYGLAGRAVNLGWTPSRSSSSTRISVAAANRPRAAPGSRGSWPRSRSTTWASSSAWR